MKKDSTVYPEVINVRLSTQHYKQLKVYANKSGATTSALVRVWIEEKLKREKD